MKKKKEIEKFLSRFHTSGDVDKVFTQGCCYWFAIIMAIRFDSPMMYSPVDNHFTVKIHGRLYDITGDVTEKYTNSVDWSTYAAFDPNDYRRIVRDCAMF